MSDVFYDDPFGFIQVDPLTGQKTTVLPEYTPRPSPRRQPSLADRARLALAVAPVAASFVYDQSTRQVADDIRAMSEIPGNVAGAVAGVGRWGALAAVGAVAVAGFLMFRGR